MVLNAMHRADLTKLVLVLAAVLQLQGCSLLRDRRDAPWDPKQGQLFDQIPGWEGGANRVCGGQLDPEIARREGRSPRC